MLAHEGEALGVVHQAGEVDQVRCSHERQSSSNENGRSIIPLLSSHQKLVGTTSHSSACQHPGTRQEPRELRPTATYRKVTGGFRSNWGANLFAAVRLVVSTAARRGADAYQAIRAVLDTEIAIRPG